MQITIENLGVKTWTIIVKPWNLFIIGEINFFLLTCVNKITDHVCDGYLS